MLSSVAEDPGESMNCVQRLEDEFLFVFGFLFFKNLYEELGNILKNVPKT